MSNLPAITRRLLPAPHRPRQHIRIVPTRRGMRSVVVNRGNIAPILRRPMQVPTRQFKPRPRELTFNELWNRSKFREQLMGFIDRNHELLKEHIEEEWKSMKEMEPEIAKPEEFNDWLEEWLEQGGIEEIYEGRDSILVTPFGKSGTKDYHLDELVDSIGDDMTEVDTFRDPFNGKLVYAPKDKDVTGPVNDKYWHVVDELGWEHPGDFEEMEQNPKLEKSKGFKIHKELEKRKIPHVMFTARYDAAIAVPKRFKGKVKDLVF